MSVGSATLLLLHSVLVTALYATSEATDGHVELSLASAALGALAHLTLRLSLSLHWPQLLRWRSLSKCVTRGGWGRWAPLLKRLQPPLILVRPLAALSFLLSAITLYTAVSFRYAPSDRRLRSELATPGLTRGALTFGVAIASAAAAARLVLLGIVARLADLGGGGAGGGGAPKPDGEEISPWAAETLPADLEALQDEAQVRTLLTLVPPLPY